MSPRIIKIPLSGGDRKAHDARSQDRPKPVTELTRRRMKDSKVDVWHVYYGDVQVGSIGMRSGVPNDVDQWGWTCGFNSQRLRITEGTAPTFSLARGKFEEAWQMTCTSLVLDGG